LSTSAAAVRGAAFANRHRMALKGRGFLIAIDGDATARSHSATWMLAVRRLPRGANLH